MITQNLRTSGGTVPAAEGAGLRTASVRPCTPSLPHSDGCACGPCSPTPTARGRSPEPTSWSADNAAPGSRPGSAAWPAAGTARLAAGMTRQDCAPPQSIPPTSPGLPGSRLRISVTRAVCLAQSRAWRSSSAGTGREEREEHQVGLGQVQRVLYRALGGGGIAKLVARDRLEQGRRHHPYRMDSDGAVQDGASAAVAASGSCWTSRSSPMALRISPPSCSRGSSSARERSTRPVSPSSTRACSMCARIGAARVCGVTSVSASCRAARKAAIASA